MGNLPKATLLTGKEMLAVKSFPHANEDLIQPNLFLIKKEKLFLQVLIL